jgi:hypothetical protein
MTHTTTTTGNGHDTSDYAFWRDHTTISLQPVAAPSILGLFGFAVSTFMVAANMAGWYGNDTVTPLVLFPFAFAFGGIAQLLAAMWAYRARDALATGIHGAWGSFWIGYGIYQLLVAMQVLPASSTNPAAATAFGYWFIGLAALTWIGFIAALAENIAVSLVLLTLAAGSTVLAIGLTTGVHGWITAAGYVLMMSAVLAWYTASAMVLQSSMKRVVLPMGAKGQPTSPGAIARQPIQYEAGEPGVRLGQ